MSDLFQNILVPLDFTEKNQCALKVARELALQNRARVRLVHVIETIDYVEDEEIAGFYGTLQEKAQVGMRRAASAFDNTGVKVDESIIFGKRGHAIIAEVARHDVDLVVLSSHQVRLDEASHNWATLSYQVAVLCPCPVLLVK